MRKFIEDMHISVTEKDAEIIRLKMHLGDEIRSKQPQRMRKSLNESRDALQANQAFLMQVDNDFVERLQEENQQLKEQIREQRESHL